MVAVGGCAYGGRVGVGETIATTGSWSSEITVTGYGGFGTKSRVLLVGDAPPTDSAIELGVTAGVSADPNLGVGLLLLSGLEYFWVPDNAEHNWGYRLGVAGGGRIYGDRGVVSLRATAGPLVRVGTHEGGALLRLVGLELSLGLELDEPTGSTAFAGGLTLTFGLTRIGTNPL